MPRPVIFNEAASETIRIRVTPAQKAEIRQVARENRTDVSGIVRDAVNGLVSEYREGAPVFRGTKPVHRSQDKR